MIVRSGIIRVHFWLYHGGSVEILKMQDLLHIRCARCNLSLKTFQRRSRMTLKSSASVCMQNWLLQLARVIKNSADELWIRQNSKWSSNNSSHIFLPSVGSSKRKGKILLFLTGWMPWSVYKKMRFLWAFISPVTMRSSGHKPRLGSELAAKRLKE